MRSRYWNRTLRTYLMLGATILCAAELSGPANASEQEGVAYTAVTAAGENGVHEDAACTRCHENVVKGSLNTPHAADGSAPGVRSVTCGDCHGPGEAHIQSGGDRSKIFNPTNAAANQVDERCLKCHAGKHALFERSAHGIGNVSCTRCHRIHSPRESKYLLTMKQPDLCFQCHGDQKIQFSNRYHHKVVEGVILCTDCHEPHGSYGEQLQRLTTEQDFICTKCHTEMAGPFSYEHDIVKTEGCIACHSPHGGPNPHMLNRTRVNTICLLCHFPRQISSAGESLAQAHEPTAKGQLCTDCHADIHGSNMSAVFLKKK